MIFFANSSDRVYNGKELNLINEILFSDGVLNTKQSTQALWKTAGDFLIEATGSSMSITAKAGVGVITVNVDGSDERLIISESDPLVATVGDNAIYAVRNDTVVLRVNQALINADGLNEDGDNAVTLVVVAGNSATPLTDNEISVALSGDPYIKLANIAVPQNATEINQTNITDIRTIVKMSRAAKLASDAIRLYAVQFDPQNLEKGDIWFNETEGILKMYDGENAIALQNQAFDWGYYPPNGIDQKLDTTSAVVENVGGVGNQNKDFYQANDLLGSGSFTVMEAQVFKMPNVSNPFLRVKMGNPTYQAGISFQIYTANINNQPDTLIETALSLAPSEVPKNDYVNLYLDGSLYTPGQNYVLVLLSTTLGFINGAPSDFKSAEVQASTFTDPDGFLLGTRRSSLSSQTTNPLSLPWSGSPNPDINFVMSISEREELRFGKTDLTTNIHKISQAFVVKSKDMISFRVIKGEDVGSPSDDINIHLYESNENNEPIGNVLTSALITEAEWAVGDSGTDKDFNLAYDNLIVGKKYVVVIEVENYSDTDNYTMYFASSSQGMAKRWNTANGWVNLNGNLFFETITSPNRKIVVTNDQGEIPVILFNRDALLNLLPKAVYEQSILLSSLETLVGDGNQAFGSNNDGSVLYLYNGNNQASGRGLYRFEKDITTGKYIQTHRVNNPTLLLPNGDNGSIVVIGDYIYLFSNNGTNIVCARFLASDLTGETAMTVPTVANTSHITAWTNGVNVYIISAQSNTTARQWTLSGTTFTASATFTVSSDLSSANISSFYDGFSAYIAKRSGEDIFIYKLTNIDGTSYDTTTKKMSLNRLSDIVAGAIICSAGENAIYVGVQFYSWNELTADARIANVIKLIPISKP